MEIKTESPPKCPSCDSRMHDKYVCSYCGYLSHDGLRQIIGLSEAEISTLKAERDALKKSEERMRDLGIEGRKALRWALDLLDMYDKRLAGIDGNERVYSKAHVEAKTKAEAALVAMGGRSVIEDGAGMRGIPL